MIGVFDSGVGGLYALRALRACLPDADLLYFGDVRNLPYGSREPWELLALGRRAIHLLQAHGARVVLSACGTVSSVALPALRRSTSLPLYGILEATVEAAAQDGGGEILLLATEATVRAGRLAAMLEDRCHTRVTALACPAFVTMAEEGGWQPEVARSILAAVQDTQPGTVVLGCTHFSRFAREIGDLFRGARLIDGAREAACAMAAALPPSLRHGSGQCTVFSSGGDGRLFEACEEIYGKCFQAGHI
jgi:glutamate racemase